MTSIGDYAFYGCSGLTSVTIGNSVTSIGSCAFWGCSGLTTITIPNSVTSIGDWAFEQCSSLTSITIPNSVTSIGSSAFRGCYFLYSSFIYNSALTDSYNWGATLVDVDTDDGLIIKDNTVIKCRPWATSVTIPNSVTSIGQSAFEGCSGLTSVTIPNSVTSIGEWAFQNCSGLKEVHSMIEQPFAISDNVFLYDDNGYKFISATLYVPKGTKKKYEAVYAWNKFKTIVEIEVSDQPLYDVNGDMTIDVADIASVIDVMAKGTNDPSADVNQDGAIDVADIATIIDAMADQAREQGRDMP